jgi:hypothetical protein
MGVSILQYKGNRTKRNKLKSSAIGKNPWDYRIGTPQRIIIYIVALTAHTSGLAKAKRLVEFFIK